MIDNKESIRKALKLTRTQGQIYFYLLKIGLSSVTTIEKNINSSRTNIYRALDELIKKKLVHEVVGENSKLFETCPFEDLKIQVWNEKHEIKSLENDLDEVVEYLSDKVQFDLRDTKIKYYEGRDGLTQALWNQTKAKKEFRIYEISMLNDFTSDKFSRDLLIEFVRNKIIDYQLTNLEDYEEFTDVKEFINNHWKVRYIDKKELPIIFECAVYNDVYSMYDFKDGQLFCVEIYNRELAEMQKDMFDLVWEFATPMRLINKFGKTRVIR